MRNFLTSVPSLTWLSSGRTRFQPQTWLALVLLTLSFTILEKQSFAQVPATAPQTPATAPQPPATAPQPPATAPQPPANNAPPQLINLLSQIDAAASQRNVEGVMQFYSQNFTHSDGLTRQSMTQALTQLWQRYPQLKYQTTVQSWQPQGNAIVAETITNITGAQPQNMNMVFDATIKSRQRYEDGKIVQQEILSVRTQLRSGDKPPTVQFKLPEQVKTGQQYNFDAFVQEPLGEEYLIGAVIEEPIKPENYLNPSRVDLELLSSGGLFKVGRAPSQPNNQWISAILIRGDGMTMVTQRLNVAGQRPTALRNTVRNQNLGVQPRREQGEQGGQGKQGEK